MDEPGDPGRARRPLSRRPDRKRTTEGLEPPLRIKEGDSGLTAGQVMCREVITVEAGTTVEEVHDLFQANNISGAPVVDEDGELVGIISEDDLVFGQMGFTDKELHRMEEQAEQEWLARQKGQQPSGSGEKPPSADREKKESHTVGEIMTVNPIAAEEETPLEELCRLMWNFRIHRVPIIRQGKVTGIVSAIDLCRLVTEGRIRILLPAK